MAKKQGNMNWLLDNEESINQVVKDSNGNVLQTGDTVIAIKDIKVKGASDIKR
jgi:protein PhnA